ncbi:MAG TPA: hypothetical protein PK022_10210, partial [Syntrophales bacterium]|nr:hypothetical protein [Syntrophales bacterium]
AASWKGLLRWACRMQAGLSDHLEKHDMKMDGWKDPSWIVHLFGNEKGEDKDFRSGTLACYPTWFNKVSFEVINPHSRRRRAGTQPIYYEVVPAGTKGRLRLLYAPLPGEIENDKVTPADCINSFIDFIGSIRELLETYGISAKRTAGWGTAKINNGDSKVWFLEGSWIAELIDKSAEKGKEEPPPEEFRKLLDENGSPIKILLDGNGKLLSKTQFRKLKVEKPCTSSEFEKFKDWYNEHGSEYSGRQRSNTENMPSIQIRELPFDKFKDARNRPRDARNGGDK